MEMFGLYQMNWLDWLIFQILNDDHTEMAKQVF